MSGTSTCDWRVFCKQQRQRSNAQSGWLCAQADAMTSLTTARSRLKACIEGTTPSGGWIRRRTGERSSVDQRCRSGLNSPCAKTFFSDQYRKAASSILFFGTREMGNRLEGSGHQSTFEGADRVGKGAEVAMDNGSRTAHGDS